MRSEPNENNNNTNQSSYLQTDTIPGTDGRTIPHITCYVCGKKGHYSDKCPNIDNGNSNEQHAHIANDRQPVHEETQIIEHSEQMLQYGSDDGVEEESEIIHFSWSQIPEYNNKYSDTDILLDTGSTFSVFKNPQMVLNVRPSKTVLKAHTNGGRQDSRLVADFPVFFYSMV